MPVQEAANRIEALRDAAERARLAREARARKRRGSARDRNFGMGNDPLGDGTSRRL